MSFSTHSTTFSAEETEKVGEYIGELLQPGDVIYLTGDLGAGKTTLVKGIIHKLTGTAPQDIISPTFSYVHFYKGHLPVYHFDLYRLNSNEEFLQAGFHEFLEQKGVSCIEWPDRLPQGLVSNPLHIHISYLSHNQRTITLERNHAS